MPSRVSRRQGSASPTTCTVHPAPRTVNVKGRFSVEIRDRHFAYEEIRSLFGSLVRDGLLEPAPASTRQRDKLERLRQFVAERRYHCSPPLAWIDIADDWNEGNPDEHYTVRAIQRAYKKICRLHGEERPLTMRGRRRRPRPPE